MALSSRFGDLIEKYELQKMMECHQGYSHAFFEEYEQYLKHVSSQEIAKKTKLKNKKEIFLNILALENIYKLYMVYSEGEGLKEWHRDSLLLSLETIRLSDAAKEEGENQPKEFEKRTEFFNFLEINAEVVINLMKEMPIDVITANSNKAKNIFGKFTGEKDKKNSKQEVAENDEAVELLVILGQIILNHLHSFNLYPDSLHHSRQRKEVEKIFNRINFHSVFCHLSMPYFKVAQKYKKLIFTDTDLFIFNSFFVEMFMICLEEYDDEESFKKGLTGKFEQHLKNKLKGFNLNSSTDLILAKKSMDQVEASMIPFFEFMNESLLVSENPFVLDQKSPLLTPIKTPQDLKDVIDYMRLMSLCPQDILRFNMMILNPFAKLAAVPKASSFLNGNDKMALEACEEYVVALLKKYKCRFNFYIENDLVDASLLALCLFEETKKHNINIDQTLITFAENFFFLEQGDKDFKRKHRISTNYEKLEYQLRMFVKRTRHLQHQNSDLLQISIKKKAA